MIYFDNAATTFKKPLSVKLSTLIALQKYSANPGRSGHKLSLRTAEKIFETRVRVADFFNCPKIENVIFTKNCTEALNLAILGCLKEKGNVIATCFEHNSVLRPLKQLEHENKISLTIVSPENKRNITLEDIKKEVKNNTYLICVTHISNVTGNKNDIESIGKYCKENNILFLVDAAQSAGHEKINMEKQNINFLCFAGHKGLFAPQGIGGLCINTEKIPKPLTFGGTGTNSKELTQPKTLPEYYESGTLSTPLIIGLNSGVKYVDKNFDRIKNKTKKLTKTLYQELSKLENITIYTDKNSNSGVISFNIKNKSSTDVANILDEKFNIAVRSGLHCAPLAHEFLKTTNQGTVRISLNHFNSIFEIKKFIKAIKTLIQQLSTKHK